MDLQANKMERKSKHESLVMVGLSLCLDSSIAITIQKLTNEMAHKRAKLERLIQANITREQQLEIKCWNSKKRLLRWRKMILVVKCILGMGCNFVDATVLWYMVSLQHQSLHTILSAIDNISGLCKDPSLPLLRPTKRKTMLDIKLRQIRVRLS